MVKIRFTRVGRKATPFYRIVAIHAREKRDSKAIEFLGTYSPITKEVNLENERIQYWLGVGAQPSETVSRLLVKANLLDKSVLPTTKFAKKTGKKATERNAKKADKAAAAAEAKAEPTVETTVETTEEPAAEPVAEETVEVATETAPEAEASA